MGLGSEIRNPERKTIPDPGVKKTSDSLKCCSGPDPPFLSNADLDPAFHFADPDPDPHQSEGNLRPLVYTVDHKVHRVVTAAFWRTFNHEGKLPQAGEGGG
jgi:hypothetical protein